MRHLWSLLAGVVAAPLAWVLVSMGQAGSTDTVTGWLDSGQFDTADLIEPAAYLLVAGVLLGLVGTLRFSPVGPLAAGLLLIAPYVGLFVDPFAVRDAVPDSWDVLDRELPLRTPLDNGTLLLLGALLVMAAFSVQRWRRWPAAVSPDDEPAADTSADPWPMVPAASAPDSDREAEPETVESPSAGVNPWTTPPTRPTP